MHHVFRGIDPMIGLPQRFCEELPDIIECITDILAAMFEVQTLVIQTVDGLVGVTQDQEIGSDRQLGKRKRTYGPTRRSEQLDVAMASVRDPISHDVFTKDEWPHEHVCGRSMYDRCRWR